MSAVLQATVGAGVELTRSIPGQDALLTPETLEFLAGLHRRFEPERQARLAARARRQASFDAGALPDFRQDTAALRAADWTVAPLPASLLDRRVEITGPVDPKMVINALNSGAQVYMADFEDSTSPTWTNLLTGQHALRDAVAGTLAFDTGARQYRLRPADAQAVLMVRPRGWHLSEKHRARRRRADQRKPVRPRPVRLPQRPRARGEGPRPVFLPAQAAVDGRSGALGRRPLARRAGARPAARGR